MALILYRTSLFSILPIDVLREIEEDLIRLKRKDVFTQLQVKVERFLPRWTAFNRPHQDTFGLIKVVQSCQSTEEQQEWSWKFVTKSYYESERAQP
jgi:hypothetical protein